MMVREERKVLLKIRRVEVISVINVALDAKASFSAQHLGLLGVAG